MCIRDSPEYVRLKKEMNVRQALDAIRRQGENAETVYINYVVERKDVYKRQVLFPVEHF